MKTKRQNLIQFLDTSMENLSKYIEVALAIHAAASALCALTRTPNDDEILSKAYKVLEFLALNIGRAKQR